jgi:hypothetical protein
VNGSSSSKSVASKDGVRSLLRRLYRALVPAVHRRALHRILHAEEFRRIRSAVHPSPKGTFALRNCDARRAIFVHTPKAAGTSIALSVFGELPYHYTAADYVAIFGRATYEAYFTFSFVRNPWDRLVSAYQYLRNGGWDARDELWSRQHLSPYTDFADFVRRGLRTREVLSFMHFRPQVEFVCDWRGRIAVDHLGYFETIDADFAVVCTHLGVAVPLAHTNRSTERDYRVHYDEETRGIVARVYARDIRTFGYAFDGIARRATGRRPLTTGSATLTR